MFSGSDGQVYSLYRVKHSGNLLGGGYYDVVNCDFTNHMGGEVCMGGEPIFMLGGGGARGNLKKNAKEISHIEIFRS